MRNFFMGNNLLWLILIVLVLSASSMSLVESKILWKSRMKCGFLPI